MGCDSCKQFGGKRLNRTRKGGAMPLSYLNTKYVEPSAPSGSDRLISEPLLARPSLNHTGGKRNKKRTRKSRRGGFYPSAMGGLIKNGAKLLPAAGVQAYRMVRNYKSSRKNL
jgi:hypothetical protein